MDAGAGGAKAILFEPFGGVVNNIIQVRYGLHKRTPNYILYIGFLLYGNKLYSTFTVVRSIAIGSESI